MSVHAYAWAWQQPTLGDSDKLVLLALSEFADPTGICWPSHLTIARMTGRSRMTVIRAIEELIRQGLLMRVKGNGRSNTYRLCLDGPRYPAEVGGDPIERARSTREARHAEFADVENNPQGVSPCDTYLSHGETPTCLTVIHPLSHSSDTPGVTQLCDTNRKEPLVTTSGALPRHLSPDEIKRNLDGINAIRRQLALGEIEPESEGE